jgi:hypothetical protein
MRELTELERQILRDMEGKESWQLVCEILEGRIADEEQAQLSADDIDRVRLHRARRETLRSILELPRMK